jgi:hypothetical protein
MSVNPNGEQPNAVPTDLAGYQSVEDLVRGYRASGEEAKRLRDRQAQIERQYAELSERVTANQTPTTDPYSELSALGIADPIRTIIQREIGNAFQPIARQLSGAQEGRTRMLANYGADYTKYESDVAQFIAQDTDMSARYQRLFETDPGSAMDYAFLKFGESRRRQNPLQTTGAPEQRTEASMPGSRQGGPPAAADNQAEVLRAAWEHYQKTGRPEAYAKARLRQVVSDEFLNQ